MSREIIQEAKRIVIKVGSSTLTGGAGQELNRDAISKIVAAVAQLRSEGREVVVVSIVVFVLVLAVAVAVVAVGVVVVGAVASVEVLSSSKDVRFFSSVKVLMELE